MAPGDATAREAQVLLMLASAAPRSVAQVVDVRELVPALRMARREIYAAVLALSDEGLLEYVGAGPRVRVTDAGMSQARSISPREATA